MSGFYSYLLRCADGSLYSGFTVDPARRLYEHNAGRGSRCTRSRRPVTLAALWAWPDKSSAMRAESLVKRMTRAQKLLLVGGDAELPGGERVGERGLRDVAAEAARLAEQAQGADV